MAKKTETAEKKAYTAQTNIQYDGEDYQSGDVIELDGQQAEALLAVGAIAEIAVLEPPAE